MPGDDFDMENEKGTFSSYFVTCVCEKEKEKSRANSREIIWYGKEVFLELFFVEKDKNFLDLEIVKLLEKWQKVVERNKRKCILLRLSFARKETIYSQFESQ